MILNTLIMDMYPFDLNTFKSIDNYYKSIAFQSIGSGYNYIEFKQV